MSKNVAVFVDVANIFYAAKAAGVDIDYVTLLKASSAGRDLVRAYAYTGLDPDNENQRNFHDFLRRHGYKVVSKDIRKYGDGKVKANLDIELVVDMMKTARNLDVAIVVSGDGDFAPAIRAVQEMGVRVEVVSFRGNTSSDLIDVADIFTDITQIAKVEKGSSRSGRRVATDEEDLSMTEVPDKMTEGTGDGRRRGRGSRSRAGEPAAPRAATPRAAATRTSASRSRSAAAREVVVEGALVALPGEKLSRAARAAAEPDAQPAPDEDADLELEAQAEDLVEGLEGGPDVEGGDSEGLVGEDGHRRRRRRRGGRGRGRGRGREGQAAGEGVEAAEGGERAPESDEFEPEPLPAPRRPAFSFGSVWDSQLGKAPAAAAGPSAGRLPEDDEDLEEPSIPEYLIAERRQRDAGRGRPGQGGRGRGGAYAAALDRERFGGGRGSTVSRFAEPMQRHREGNIVREPGARQGIGPGRAGGRGGAPSRGFERPEPRGSSSEPWSEVPPEIEAMLRAQLAGSGRAARPTPTREGRPQGGPSGGPTTEAGSGARPGAGVPDMAAAPSGAPTRGRRSPSPRRASTSATTEAPPSSETPAVASPAAVAKPPAVASPAAVAKPPARGRRGTRASSAGGAAEAAAPGVTTQPEAAGAPGPKRARRSTAAPKSALEAPAGESPAAPKRRTTRRKTAAAD